jgi:hypothetical protein
MTPLKLDENYKVEKDENNFVLIFEKEAYNEKTKKNYMQKDRWYYPKLSQVLDKYLNECLRPIPDIENVYKELIRVEKLIALI